MHGIYVDCCFHPKEMRLGIRLIWIYIYIYGVWNFISCKLVLLLLQLRLQPKIDQMKEQVKPALCDFIEADTNYKRLKKDINKHKSKNKKDEDEEADEPEEEEKPSKRIKKKQSPTDPETSTKSGKGNKAKAKKKARAAPPSPAKDEPPKKKKRALKGSKASKWNWFWWWPFSISVQKRFAKTPCFEKDLKRDGFGSLHGENLIIINVASCWIAFWMLWDFTSVRIPGMDSWTLMCNIYHAPGCKRMKHVRWGIVRLDSTTACDTM